MAGYCLFFVVLVLGCPFGIVAEFRCPYPASPLHGYHDWPIGDSADPGDVVDYRCDVGFSLFGSRRRQCDSNREWSGTFPTCASLVSAGKPASCQNLCNSPNRLVDQQDSTCVMVTSQFRTQAITIDLLGVYSVSNIFIHFKGFAEDAQVRVELQAIVGNESTVLWQKQKISGIDGQDFQVDVSPVHWEKTQFVHVFVAQTVATRSLQLCEISVFSADAPSPYQCASSRSSSKDKINMASNTVVLSEMDPNYGMVDRNTRRESSEKTSSNSQCVTFHHPNPEPRLTWDEAKSACEDEGGRLLKAHLLGSPAFLPDPKLDVVLQSHTQTFSYWLDGKIPGAPEVPDVVRNPAMNPNRPIDSEEHQQGVPPEMNPVRFPGNERRVPPPPVLPDPNHRIALKDFSLRNGQPCVSYDGQNRRWTNQACYNKNGWICQSDLKLCGHPEVPENGYLDPGSKNTSVGARVKYLCANGHHLKGNKHRECLRSGAWSGEVPECFPGDDAETLRLRQDKASIGVVAVVVIACSSLTILLVILAIIYIKKRKQKNSGNVEFSTMQTSKSAEELDAENGAIKDSRPQQSYGGR